MPTKSKPRVKVAIGKSPTSGKRRTATSSATQTAKRGRSQRAASQPAKATGTKQSQVIALLSTATGAQIAQLTKATGWQPHTVRGLISGTLRKRLGLNVTCSAADASGNRTYRIVDAGAA